MRKSFSWILGLLCFFYLQKGFAALPPATFSECYNEYSTSSALTPADLKDMASRSRTIVCQNQLAPFSKEQLVDLLKNRVEVTVSAAGTNYTKEDIVQMAAAGTLYLIDDSPRFIRENLVDIARAGAQMAITSGGTGLIREDLISIGKERKFLYVVNSPVQKTDLSLLLAEKIPLVIYVASSGLLNTDVVELSKIAPELVTVKP